MATTNEGLIIWFEKQSVWIQDAVVTYYNNGLFTEDDVKRFARECINEASGKKTKFDLTNLNLLSRDDRKSFILKSISNVEGVNALAPKTELSFGSNGITVVYGENGAGKSGYIRIFKRLADAKYKEKLLHNVYVPEENTQSCNVTVECDGTETILNCDLEKNGEHAILRDIDIFDTRISTAYIEDANEATYEPWVFLLFRELADVSKSVKNQIDAFKNSYDSHEIKIPEDYIGTKVGNDLASITVNSTFDEEYFSWRDDDNELLIQKEKEANLEALKSQIVQLKNEIGFLTQLKEYFEKYIDFFSEDYVKRIGDTKNKLIDAKKEFETAQVLFSQEASEMDIASVSIPAWKSLWQDVKAYYDEFLFERNIVKYTEPDGICPLCGKTIGDEQAQRIKTIDEYINGNVSQKVATVKLQYLTLLKKCPKAWDPEHLSVILNSCGVEDGRPLIESFASEIYKVSSMIESSDIEKTQIENIDISSITRQLAAIIHEKETEKKNKETLIQDEDHKKLESDIQELKAKRFVSSLKDEVFERINYLKIAKKHDEAMKCASTNRLSTKSKELVEELITIDYVRRFNEELKALTKGTVKALLKQQNVNKSKVPFRIVLESANNDRTKVDEVFSEGEKRVVSLAAFFAESSGKNIMCPLIVDDPISSLDLKFESLVINRLVEVGRQRQVIVFTHRLSMLVGLYDSCKENNVDYSELELVGRGKYKGVPTESAHSGAQSLGKLKDLKNANLAKVKKMDPNSEEYTQAIHYICQQIRNHVEKSVEDTLIYGVVQRYRKSINTLNKIDWLAQISENDCNIVDEMMTKYSSYDHSMSDETPLQEFTIEELEADLDKIITWLDDVKARQRSMKK